MSWRIMDSTSEDRLLFARAADAVALCEKYSYPHFIGFLDERQRALLTPYFKQYTGVIPLFWGGHEQAERTLLGAFPHFIEQDTALFPLTALTFRYRETAALSHRDFLGTLLSTGIRREKVGDILCFSGKTVAFVSEDVAAFLCEQITKVGGEGVTLTMGLDEELQFSRAYKELQMTVASPRLDNVVKALTGLSREKAAAAITSALVSCDHQLCQNVSKTVCEGNILSIRGYGRFRIVSLSDRTKKDRIVLVAHKYL